MGHAAPACRLQQRVCRRHERRNIHAATSALNRCKLNCKLHGVDRKTRKVAVSPQLFEAQVECLCLQARSQGLQGVLFLEVLRFYGKVSRTGRQLVEGCLHATPTCSSSLIEQPQKSQADQDSRYSKPIVIALWAVHDLGCAKRKERHHAPLSDCFLKSPLPLLPLLRLLSLSYRSSLSTRACASMLGRASVSPQASGHETRFSLAYGAEFAGSAEETCP